MKILLFAIVFTTVFTLRAESLRVASTNSEYLITQPTYGIKKLYYASGASSLCVHIVMNELGLNAESEAVDLKNKKTEKGEDFYKINPLGFVPIIQLNNGKMMTEVAVILQYLADTSQSGAKIFPKIGDFRRYRVMQWLNFTASELHKSLSLLANPKIPDSTKKEVIIEMIKNKLYYLDHSLEGTDYLVGNQFTIADGYLFLILYSLKNDFKFDMAPWKNISRYYEKLLHRPSIIKALTQEKDKIS